MPAPITDAFSKIPSRQVRYQKRNRAEGLCILCRVPAEGKLHCADCIKRTKEKRAKTQRLHRAAPSLLVVAKMALLVSRMELGQGLAPDFGPRELMESAVAAITAAEGENV